LKASAAHLIDDDKTATKDPLKQLLKHSRSAFLGLYGLINLTKQSGILMRIFVMPGEL
jgi:hypothetical protein